MATKYRIWILFILFATLSACTPYDSNKVNKELIQGKWVLANASVGEGKTLETIDYSDDITYLIFKGDSCAEHMPDMNNENDYRFKIHDYLLGLYYRDTLISTLNIEQLTTDSLTLRSTDGWSRIYKKTE